MMNNGTRVHRRWRRRASTVIGLGVAAVMAFAVPALAHPTFPNDGPGFPNPQGSTTNPYPPGSRPTLNMFVEFEQDGVIFNGAEDTTVDVQVTIPNGWTNPACGPASTSVDNRQVGTVVPGWTCTVETANAHQVLHWHGPQISPSQTNADSAQFFTFPVTVPSPANNTSYGAVDGPEGIHVKQTYASGLTALWKPPNDTAGAGEVANGLVRTVAGTSTATTTTFNAFPHPAFSGLPVVLLATVAPSGATGTVQFQDGTTAVGAPVRVLAGSALLLTRLPAGTHSLTAVFAPTDPAAFAASTSPPVALPVRPLF